MLRLAGGGDDIILFQEPWVIGGKVCGLDEITRSLVQECEKHRIGLVIGCDANAHHTQWESTDTNPRAFLDIEGAFYNVTPAAITGALLNLGIDTGLEGLNTVPQNGIPYVHVGKMMLLYTSSLLLKLDRFSNHCSPSSGGVSKEHCIIRVCGKQRVSGYWFGKSAVYNVYKAGPRTLPCGTPAPMGRMFDRSHLTSTIKELPSR
ncbi:GH22321 [Drosophila grimshawi]|uniref:GH22321 n=1 Tax=Drosophila grimshawi TaxID=7222 RepID=B4JYW9_DROGR|nr:GH22321 [Drosophila grimshawi]